MGNIVNIKLSDIQSKIFENWKIYQFSDLKDGFERKKRNEILDRSYAN